MMDIAHNEEISIRFIPSPENETAFGFDRPRERNLFLENDSEDKVKVVVSSTINPHKITEISVAWQSGQGDISPAIKVSIENPYKAWSACSSNVIEKSISFEGSVWSSEEFSSVRDFAGFKEAMLLQKSPKMGEESKDLQSSAQHFLIFVLCLFEKDLEEARNKQEAFLKEEEQKQTKGKSNLLANIDLAEEKIMELSDLRVKKQPNDIDSEDSPKEERNDENKGALIPNKKKSVGNAEKNNNVYIKIVMEPLEAKDGNRYVVRFINGENKDFLGKGETLNQGLLEGCDLYVLIQKKGVWYIRLIDKKDGVDAVKEIKVWEKKGAFIFHFFTGDEPLFTRLKTYIQLIGNGDDGIVNKSRGELFNEVQKYIKKYKDSSRAQWLQNSTVGDSNPVDAFKEGFLCSDILLPKKTKFCGCCSYGSDLYDDTNHEDTHFSIV